MTEPEALQQINRTYVRYRERTLSYFGGCDYFRLASHPTVLKAVGEGLRRYGLNVAASRVTSGNHPLYQQLERKLARFFHSEAALLLGTGYATNLAVAQAFAGQFSHALVDARAHVSMTDASLLLGCPVLKFKHRDVENFAHTLRRCGRGARPIALTDGMFGHNGSTAPLKAYLKLLPRDGLLLVDDAHAAGTLGKTGAGTIELEGLSRERVVQCITLSKALGVYGGAVIGSRKLRAQIASRSNIFVGSTPLPLPLAFAACEALRIVKSNKALRQKLKQNTDYVKGALRREGLNVFDAPGPIATIRFSKPRANALLKRALLSASILPPFINYPGGPTGGYFRFAISSEHTRWQLDNLLRTLKPFAHQAAAQV